MPLKAFVFDNILVCVALQARGSAAGVAGESDFVSFVVVNDEIFPVGLGRCEEGHVAGVQALENAAFRAAAIQAVSDAFEKTKKLQK